MKKKLLYGLAGLLVALSLVGFASCSDDDDDSGGGGSVSNTTSKEATYAGSEGSSVFSKVMLAVDNSSAAITGLTATYSGTEYEGTEAGDDAWFVTVSATEVYTITITEGTDGYTYDYQTTASTTYTATYKGDDSSDFTTVSVTAASGFATAVSADGSSATSSGKDTDGNSLWSLKVTSTDTGVTTVTAYIITVTWNSTDYSFTYDYTWDKTVTTTKDASYFDTESTSALADTTLSVTYVTESSSAGDSDSEITGVSAQGKNDEAASALSANDEGVYTLSTGVDESTGEETIYYITFTIAESGSVTYSYTSVEVLSATATGGMPTGYSVNVKYWTDDSTGETVYNVAAVGIDDGSNPVVVTADSDGKYCYEVADDDTGDSTTYKITLVETEAPTYTYTFTTVTTTTTDYTAVCALEDALDGVEIVVNATVSYDSSDESYTIESVNSVAISVDDTLCYSVEGKIENCTFTANLNDDKSVTYTIGLGESISDSGVSFVYTYSYVSELYNYKVTATGDLEDINVVLRVSATYDSASDTYTVNGINYVIIGGNWYEEEDTYAYTVYNSTDSTTTLYTITLADATEGNEVAFTYSYTSSTGYAASGSIDATVLAIVEDGELTGLNIDGEEASYDSTEGTYTWGGYTITLKGSGSSYSYTWTYEGEATGALDATVVVTATSSDGVTSVTIGGTEASVVAGSDETCEFTVKYDDTEYTWWHWCEEGACVYTDDDDNEYLLMFYTTDTGYAYEYTGLFEASTTSAVDDIEQVLVYACTYSDGDFDIQKIFVNGGGVSYSAEWSSSGVVYTAEYSPSDVDDDGTINTTIYEITFSGDTSSGFTYTAELTATTVTKTYAAEGDDDNVGITVTESTTTTEDGSTSEVGVDVIITEDNLSYGFYYDYTGTYTITINYVIYTIELSSSGTGYTYTCTTEEIEAYDWSSDESMSEVTEGEYSGYVSLDVSEFELPSDSPDVLLTDEQLTKAEAVVIVFTTDSENYAEAWYSVYADSEWTTETSAGVWAQTSADTYTFVIDSSGGACSGETNGKMTVSYTDSSWVSTDTPNTPSTYASTGMYTAAANCTLDAVYILYSE